MEFDASLTWKSYLPHMHKAKTDRQRRQLDAVFAHAKGEVEADLGPVMDSLCPDPQYHEYGVFADRPGDTGPKGWDEVLANYNEMVASGTYVIESVKDRLLIDDEQIITDGRYRQILPARAAKDMGYVAEDDDRSTHYMLEGITVVFWTFDENEKALGEDRYVLDKSITPIDPADLPADYPDRLR